ncbi:MAG: sterol desaturase family protein, partial [Bacteroidetes bacterium]|nr:sterol desaturase family protein [Bacteroidota bacterium]
MINELIAAKESTLLLISIPIYIVIICIEIVLSNIHKKNLYNAKDTVMNIYLTTVNFGLDILVRGFGFIILTFFFTIRVCQIDNAYGYWILLFMGEDFLYYWEHRIDHTVRFFWAMHVTHHSSQHFNLTTGFRSSALQPLYRFVYFIPLSLLGFSAADIMFTYALTQIYGILIHTKMIHQLGILEYFMAT